MDELNPQDKEKYEQALAQRDTGDWDSAVTTLHSLVQSLGDAAPAEITHDLATWRNTFNTIQEQYPRLLMRLEKAETAYTNAPQNGEYEIPARILHNANRIWQRIEASIIDAEGRVSSDLQALYARLHRLQERAELALEVFTSPVARDGLVKLQAYTRRQGTDTTLTALEQELVAQVRGQIPELLSKADLAEQVGDLTEALDLLRKANGL
jgi:tetratricopeptide (TPR) repeat protein